MMRRLLLAMLLVAACKSGGAKKEPTNPDENLPKGPQCLAVWEPCACKWACVDTRYAEVGIDCPESTCAAEGTAPDGCHATADDCSF